MLLAQIIEEIPLLFTQLVYFAGTWDDALGASCEPRLAQEVHTREINPVLRRKHLSCFSDWVALPLARQVEELSRYLHEKDDRLAILRSWIRERSYVRLVPKEAPEGERLLFISDLEIILPLLFTEVTGDVYQ